MRNGIATPCGSSVQCKCMHLVDFTMRCRGVWKRIKLNKNQSGVREKTLHRFYFVVGTTFVRPPCRPFNPAISAQFGVFHKPCRGRRPRRPDPPRHFVQNLACFIHTMLLWQILGNSNLVTSITGRRGRRPLHIICPIAEYTYLGDEFV